MIDRLNLRLIRHELLWRARRARSLRAEIMDLIDQYEACGKAPPDYADLLRRFFDITRAIEDYELRALA